MTTPDRAFGRVVLASTASFGLPLVAGLALIGFGGGAAATGVRSMLCLLVPASMLDLVVHALAAASFVAAGLVLFAASRAFSQERAAAAEL